MGMPVQLPLQGVLENRTTSSCWVGREQVRLGEQEDDFRVYCVSSRMSCTSLSDRGRSALTARTAAPASGSQLADTSMWA
jgi:hypothetical protein